MNIYEVAKKAGVSTATISRVLNNAPGVSPETRRKVQAVMDECAYQPNAFARGLGLNSMSTVGLMCADVADAYLAGAVSFLEKGLREKGYDCFLICSGRTWDTRRECMKKMLSRHVDAIILIGSHFIEQDRKKNAYIFEAAERVPVLLIGAALDAPGVYSVQCDDREGMAQVTSLLLQRGRRNLVYLYSHASYSGLKKLEGFRLAHERAGLSVRDGAEVQTGSVDTVKAVKEALNVLMAGMPVDGIVTSEDLLAVGAVKYCAEHGLRVPEDVAVTGYNDSDLSRASTPEITSLDNKLQSLCTRAVELMINALNHEEAPKQTVFSGTMIERESTP